MISSDRPIISYIFLVYAVTKYDIEIDFNKNKPLRPAKLIRG